MHVISKIRVSPTVTSKAFGQLQFIMNFLGVNSYSQISNSVGRGRGRP